MSLDPAEAPEPPDALGPPAGALEGAGAGALEGLSAGGLEATGGDAFDLTMAVSSLASSGTDTRIMLKLLVSQLADVLGSRLGVERAGGRFRRSDEIRAVRITLGDDTLEAVSDGGSLRCSIGHASGGIRIRSDQVDMETWLTKLLGILRDEAAHSEQTRQALEHIVIGDTT